MQRVNSCRLSRLSYGHVTYRIYYIVVEVNFIMNQNYVGIKLTRCRNTNAFKTITLVNEGIDLIITYNG